MNRLVCLFLRLTTLVLITTSLHKADRNPCRAESEAAGTPAVYPGEQWDHASAKSARMLEPPLQAARQYALTGDGAGLITRHGKIILAWGDTKRKFDLKSTSKSIGVTALGLAIDDRKMRLDDLATRHHSSFGVPPEENRASGWLNEITLRHLATQTAGFEKPGGYTRLLFKPGTRWHYSDGGPNWLAECVTLAMKRDIASLMFERVLTPIGVTAEDLHWRKHQYRQRQLGPYRRVEFGSGVHANVEAMARIGLLYLQQGNWEGQQLLSREFVKAVSRPDPSLQGLAEWGDDHGNASEHYGLLWWNNADGSLADVPTDAYWSWGLYDSLIVVIPSLDVVVARAGRSWKRRAGENHYDVLAPFLGPISLAVGEYEDSSSNHSEGTDGTNSHAAMDRSQIRAPYPPSQVAAGIQWDRPATIVRLAKGSDNWPVTWMDDDALLTAYGDGWGFEPRVPEKLSLGFARVSGGPSRPRGVNLRSPTGEQTGQGPAGVKASGLLMVDGVVYLLARNCDNSQLAVSRDRGKTWAWIDWKFETSFGCPTFINYGSNYSGAPDDWVYVVSPDSSSAYEPADRMVMARVPKNRLTDQTSYEYLVSVDDQGNAHWSADIAKRGAVFKHRGRCYRGGLTYHPQLRRYLWCQTLPESTHPQGPRFQGGFGIYESPNPWGPWSTLFFTEQWDVGPGETSVLPTKWFGDDGSTVHLLFSGDDSFSVRRGVLEIATDQ